MRNLKRYFCRAGAAALALMLCLGALAPAALAAGNGDGRHYGLEDGDHGADCWQEKDGSQYNVEDAGLAHDNFLCYKRTDLGWTPGTSADPAPGGPEDAGPGTVSDLSLVRTAGVPDVYPGGTVNFIVELENRGGEDTDLVLDDVLPEGLSYAGRTYLIGDAVGPDGMQFQSDLLGGLSFDGHIDGMAVTVPAGGTLKLSYAARADADLAPGTVLESFTGALSDGGVIASGACGVTVADPSEGFAFTWGPRADGDGKLLGMDDFYEGALELRPMAVAVTAGGPFSASADHEHMVLDGEAAFTLDAGAARALYWSLDPEYVDIEDVYRFRLERDGAAKALSARFDPEKTAGTMAVDDPAGPGGDTAEREAVSYGFGITYHEGTTDKVEGMPADYSVSDISSPTHAMQVSDKIPTRAGYVFTYWTVGADGDHRYRPGDMFAFDAGHEELMAENTETVDLYAHWAAADLPATGGAGTGLILMLSGLGMAAGLTVLFRQRRDGDAA